jgi:hypothetical protein
LDAVRAVPSVTLDAVTSDALGFGILFAVYEREGSVPALQDGVVSEEVPR